VAAGVRGRTPLFLTKCQEKKEEPLTCCPGTGFTFFFLLVRFSFFLLKKKENEQSGKRRGIITK